MEGHITEDGLKVKTHAGKGATVRARQQTQLVDKLHTSNCRPECTLKETWSVCTLEK